MSTVSPTRDCYVPGRNFYPFYFFRSEQSKQDISLGTGMSPLINQVQRSTTHCLQHPFCFRFAASLSRLLLGYEWLGTITSQTSSPRGFCGGSHNTCSSSTYVVCLSFLTPCGLRARPQYKRPAFQRTLPHLKGWNLLDLNA